MKIAVCVRSVIDPEGRYRLRDDKSVDFRGAPSMMDPGDAVALEAGVALAAEHGADLTVYTAAGDGANEVLRVALAQGASSAVQVVGELPRGSLEAGENLAEVVAEQGLPDIVLCGVASSDGGSGGTGAVLAARLDLPIIQNTLAFDGIADGLAEVQRRRDGGYRELVRVQLPAVFTIESIAAVPRFPTTRERLHAQRASITTVEADAAQDLSTGELEVLGYRIPPPRLLGIPWPGSELSARERLRFLVQGGQTRQASAGGPLTGDAESVAGAIADYLQTNGFVPPSTESGD